MVVVWEIPKKEEWVIYQNAYYTAPTGKFTGPSVGHKYLRKHVTNIRRVPLDRSP